MLIVLTIPIYPAVGNMLKNFFTMILCKEIIDKKNLSDKEYAIFFRHMRLEKFKLLRKLVIKHNIDKILQHCYSKNLNKYNDIFNITSLVYNKDYIYKDVRTAHFCIALRNILIAYPNYFEKVQECVINKTNSIKLIELIYYFAIAIEDLEYNFSFKKLYAAIDDKTIRRQFEIRFQHKEEIGKLVSLV